MSVPPPPYICSCDGVEHLLHAVHGGIATGDDDFAGISELAGERRQLGDRSRELLVLHRARGVDQESRPRPRLIERRHDELAVTRLAPMRTAIGAIVSAERALAQRGAHRAANDRHVVDLRRHHAVRPAPPAERHFAGEAGDVHDALRDIAPHHFRLHRHRRPACLLTFLHPAAAPTAVDRRARPIRSPALAARELSAAIGLGELLGNRAPRSRRWGSRTCRAAADRRAAAGLRRRDRR